MLPAALAGEIEAVIKTPIANVSQVDGGCVSPAARLQTSQNVLYFVKWATRGKGRPLAAEAFALEHIAETNTVRVPNVIAYGSLWLLLEWLPPGAPTDAAWASFGRDLARLHRCRHEQFGWSQANFIGSLPQQNGWSADWSDFWRDQRLEPQLSHAVDGGRLGRGEVARFEQLFARLAGLLAVGQDEGASLLHGDLWGGNAHPTGDVIAAVDPSAYYGHREVDLAMAALFGGFPRAFWSGYEEEWPVQQAGFSERRAVYQLYYLLVHVNMFGGGYAARVRDALSDALG